MLRTFISIVLATLVAGTCVLAAPEALAASGVPETPATEAYVAKHALVPEAVVVFNRPIVTFRSPLLSTSVERRAEAASERIRTMLAKPGEHRVTVENEAQGSVVKIDGELAFGIVNDDVEGLGPEALAGAAADAARSLETVIAEMSEARDPRAILRSVGWTLAATALWLALLWATFRIMNGTSRRIAAYAERKGADLHRASAEIVNRDQVVSIARGVTRVLFWIVALLVTYQWLGYALTRFPYTRPWGEGLAHFLVDTFFGMLSSIANSIPGLVVAIVVFVIARLVQRLLQRFFDSVQSQRLRVSWIDADSAQPTRRLVIIAVWLFAAAMAYPYLPGAGTDAFKGLTVLLGLMVSVGASGIVGQAASGLILMYTHTYRAGDFVRVGDHEGTVASLGLFTTRVRTGMGEELTFPNAMVLGVVTKNYSRSVRHPGFVVDASVTIGYDTPWRQVHAMLIEAARRTDGVLADPRPIVFQVALSDFYVEYKLVCQALPADPRPRALVVSALLEHIQDVFNENGVQIMSPHYLDDPEHAKVVPKGDWYAPPAKPPA